MRANFIWSAIFPSALLAWAGSANAGPLDAYPASIGLYANADSSNPSDPGTGGVVSYSPGTIMSNSPQGTGPGSATATALFGADPLVQVSATVPEYNGNGPYSSASAEAILNYYFEVLGPDGGSVPVIIASQGATSGPNASASIQGAVSAQAGATVIANCDVIYDPTTCGTDLTCQQLLTLERTNCTNAAMTFSTSGPYMITPNTPTLVELAAIAQVSNSYTGDAGTSTASIDPIIYIDPTYSLAGNYTIVFSDAAPVTEPPAGAAVGFGLLALIVAARMQRKERVPTPRSSI